MRRSIRWLICAGLALALAGGETMAGRGGGFQRGGFRGGGGGGGFRGGGGGGGGFRGDTPSFNRTPSFNMPAARPQMPSGGLRPSMPQRPTTLPGNIGGNRPNLPQRPNLPGNRPNLPGNNVNRPNLPDRPGTLPGNRPNLPGNIGGNRPNLPGNRPNFPGNRPDLPQRPNVPGNRPNRPGDNWNNVNRPGWPGGRPAWSYRPGWNYHRGWVNGYWHGQNNTNWWNNWGGFASGLALGGIGAWGIGSSLWNWGYMPYSNPYYVDPGVVAAAAAPVYDYSQPLSTEAPPPEESAADQAVQVFDAARAAFLAGNYDDALRQTDQALKALPTDAAMHEFRALCLFALNRYDESAATLYAVLSAGPGWDWTTMARLYPSVDVYTTQIRALEAYIGEHPTSASARFVLAYHYLTQGHNDSAVDQLKEVLKLQPSDRLSAQIVAQLSGKAEAAPLAEAEAPNPAAEPAAAAAPAPEGNLAGSWKASPAPDTTIELTAQADGSFRWTVTDKGKPHTIEGKYTYGNGILAMSQNDASALVGKVTWKDDSHFLFQAMGGGPGDPGLSFSK